MLDQLLIVCFFLYVNLKDFYSHSNWVELGKKVPNSNLLRSDTSIGNIAGKQMTSPGCVCVCSQGKVLRCSSAAIDRATCRNCDGDDCSKNILEDILEQDILTSGYFGVVPLVSTKPKGKRVRITASSAVSGVNMPKSNISSCVHFSLLLHVVHPAAIFMFQLLHVQKLDQGFQ